MFVHDKFGIITSHTREEFERLPKGSAFGVLSWAMAGKLAIHLQEGKPWNMFPNCYVTRELAGFVLAHYSGDSLPPEVDYYEYEEPTGIDVMIHPDMGVTR